ncbi:MAG: amidoligase family protein [Rhodospirillales bacterium]
MSQQRQPPKTTNDAGEPRRIGVEIEFGGLDLDRAAELVEQTFGGRIERPSPHVRKVTGTGIGDFEIELDAQMVHPKSEADDFEKKAKEIIGDLSSGFVPTEIVGPPAPLDALPDFDRLIDALRDAGAEGTEDGLSYAFGLQLNPEAASLKAEDILSVLQAYILMSPLLRRRIRVDPLRWLLPYVDPFPADYARRILAPGYAPDMDNLIDDFITDNPTRNRELDMLPLFAHLDEGRVRARVDDPLIKARPTYHYRLPNTNLADPEWGAITEWNRWVIVERLAAAPNRRRQLADTYLERNPEDFMDWLTVRARELFDEFSE